MKCKKVMVDCERCGGTCERGAQPENIKKRIRKAERKVARGQHDCVHYLRGENEKIRSECEKLKREKEKVEHELQVKNDMIVALNTGMQTLNEYHEVQRRAIERRLDNIADLAGIHGALRRRRLSDRHSDHDSDADAHDLPLYSDSFEEDESDERFIIEE